MDKQWWLAKEITLDNLEYNNPISLETQEKFYINKLKDLSNEFVVDILPKKWGVVLNDKYEHNVLSLMKDRIFFSNFIKDDTFWIIDLDLFNGVYRG